MYEMNGLLMGEGELLKDGIISCRALRQWTCLGSQGAQLGNALVQSSEVLGGTRPRLFARCRKHGVRQHMKPTNAGCHGHSWVFTGMCDCRLTTCCWAWLGLAKRRVAEDSSCFPYHVGHDQSRMSSLCYLSRVQPVSFSFVTVLNSTWLDWHAECQTWTKMAASRRCSITPSTVLGNRDAAPSSGSANTLGRQLIELKEQAGQHQRWLESLDSRANEMARELLCSQRGARSRRLPRVRAAPPPRSCMGA